MSNASTGDKQIEDQPVGGWSQSNWWFVGFFLVLTVIGVVISTGILDFGIVDQAEASSDTSVRIPVYIYLYASLGALGYIFTKLMVRLDNFEEWGEFEKLAEMGLRIPAAWLLAAGIHLLYTSVSNTTTGSGPQFAAGIAFIVGLYVNVALKSLGSLADRILGRGGPESRVR